MHSFDPSHLSAQSVQMLDIINAKEDGAEDGDGPPLDISLANIAGASSFPIVPSDLDILGFGVTLYRIQVAVIPSTRLLFLSYPNGPSLSYCSI